jgi:predicted acyltransferase (DUF342 family)
MLGQTQLSTATLCWNSITPEAFEELCYHILETEGFINLEWHGQKGADRGRDITGKKVGSVLTGSGTITSFLIQCKRYTVKAVTESDLDNSITWAKVYNPDIYLLITTTVLSSRIRDWLELIQKNTAFKICLIERPQLETLIRKNMEHLQPYIPEPLYREFNIGVLPIPSKVAFENLIGLKAAPVTLSLKEQIFRNAVISEESQPVPHVYAQSIIIEQDCHVETNFYARKDIMVNQNTVIKGAVVSSGSIQMVSCEITDVCGSPITMLGPCRISGKLVTDRDIDIPPNSKISSIFSGGNNLYIGNGSIIDNILCKGAVTVGNNVEITGLLRCAELRVGQESKINSVSVDGNITIPKGVVIANLATKGSVLIETDAQVKKLYTTSDVELCAGSILQEVTCRNIVADSNISVIKLHAKGSVLVRGDNSCYKGKVIIADGNIFLPSNSTVELVKSKCDITLGQNCNIKFLVAHNLKVLGKLNSECIRCSGIVEFGENCTIGSIQAQENIVFKEGLVSKDWTIFSKEGNINGQGMVELGDTKIDAKSTLPFEKGCLLTVLTEKDQLELIEEVTSRRKE